MCRYLRKGVPSLGADLSSIFEVESDAGSEDGNASSKEVKLGQIPPLVTDAYNLRKHPVLQMVMAITQR